jgi:hypothetical protein
VRMEGWHSHNEEFYWRGSEAVITESDERLRTDRMITATFM